MAPRKEVRRLNGFVAFTYLVIIAYLLLLIYAELPGLGEPYPLARLERLIRYAKIRVAPGKPPPQEGEETKRWFMQQ